MQGSRSFHSQFSLLLRSIFECSCASENISSALWFKIHSVFVNLSFNPKILPCVIKVSIKRTASSSTSYRDWEGRIACYSLISRNLKRRWPLLYIMLCCFKHTRDTDQECVTMLPYRGNTLAAGVHRIKFIIPCTFLRLMGFSREYITATVVVKYKFNFWNKEVCTYLTSCRSLKFWCM